MCASLYNVLCLHVSFVNVSSLVHAYSVYILYYVVDGRQQDGDKPQYTTTDTIDKVSVCT